ncbi:type I toxin-antitoxin system toxin Ldr family protein [Escherichia coli]|nr:type I toxin-antitoxin system toxin Ldr family protein [Escherichia coli]
MNHQQFKNSRKMLSLQQGGYMTLAKFAMIFWHDLCNQVNHLIPTRVLVKGGEITCKILK